MRLRKKEIENITVDWRFEGDNDRDLGRLHFRFDPKDGKTYMEHSEYCGLSVEDGMAILELMKSLAPKLQKAIEDAVKDINTF